MAKYEVGAPLWVYDEQWGETVGFTIAGIDEVGDLATSLTLHEVDGDRSLEITEAELAKRIRAGSAGEPGRRGA